MKMKKMMAMLMAGVLSVGMLAGCGNTSSSNASEDGSAASTVASKGEINFILATTGEFQSNLASAMMAEGEKQGYKVIQQNAENDVSKQIQYIETCRNAGQDAAIVQPVDADATQSLIDAAGDMNIIFVNCPPTNLEELAAENVCYVGSDEDTSGYFQGEYLSDYFKAQGKTEVSYIMLQGLLGQVSTYKRSDGVIRAFEDNGITAVEATSPLACDYDRPTAQENIAPILTSGIQFDCIVANNDAMALGAVEACKAANIDIDFPIVGIDCTADGAQAIQEGTMAMTVFQNPSAQGRVALLAAVNMVNGDPINTGVEEYKLDSSGEDYSDSICWIPFEKVTKDNVADYM